MFFAKLALLLQIQRLFTSMSNQKKTIYWASWALIIANAILYTCVFFVFVFGCMPREKIWNHYVPGRCLDIDAALIATSAINLVSDVAILVLPLAGIWQLRLPLKKKIGAGLVFATGLL
jgi:hypothetical protein